MIFVDGAEVSARFALPPNSKNYCGKIGFRKAFAAFLSHKTRANKGALEECLRKFTAHYAYLKLIAGANGLQPFDREVAEALWIGNPLLRCAGRRQLQRLLLREFSGKGMLSPARAKKLAQDMPDGFVPHHSFHVLHLHTISGVIEPSLRNADLCRVSWGKVISVRGETANVQSQKLAKKGGKLALLPHIRSIRLCCAGIRLVPGLKSGDLAASHWDFAVMRITHAQARRLEKYTRQNIAAANGD